MAKTKNKGQLKFDLGTGLEFDFEPDDLDKGGDTYTLVFDENPSKFVRSLREAADFIELNPDTYMTVKLV